MDQRVLVAFASKHGATEEIAHKIGDTLGAAGLTIDVLPVDQVKDVQAYAAVILGSAVYVGQWRKEAAKFLTEQEQALARRPVWLFSSGPTGEGDPVELMQGFRFPERLQPVADRVGPRDIAFFHGALDPQRLSLGEKLVVKGVKAPLGDFRDWHAIAAWAEGIGASLTAR